MGFLSGLDSCEWTVVVDGKRVVMCLWDTAGQERYILHKLSFNHKETV